MDLDNSKAPSAHGGDTRPATNAERVVFALTRHRPANAILWNPKDSYDAFLGEVSLDLVVVDGETVPRTGPKLDAAVQKARELGVHDPATDANIYCLDSVTCDRLLGPVGTRLAADAAILEALHPFLQERARPSIDERMAVARYAEKTDADDRALVHAMFDLRQSLIAAAVHRADAKATISAYRQRLTPLIETLRASLAHVAPDSDVPGQTFQVLDPDGEEFSDTLSTDDDTQKGQLDESWRSFQSGKTRILVIPLSGAFAEAPEITRLHPDIAGLRSAMRDGISAYRLARERLIFSDLWIDTTLDDIVATAASHIGSEATRPVAAAMKRCELSFINESGSCTILGPCMASGNHQEFLLLMPSARPAEAILALKDPRQWPNLLEEIDGHPLFHTIIQERSDRMPRAKLSMSGSPSILETRRPGIKSRTQFEALRRGEQRSLTVALPHSGPSTLSGLEPGHLVRINERKNTGQQIEIDDDPAHEIDLMVIGKPKRVKLDTLSAGGLERLAQREGLTAEAYKKTLLRTGTVVTVEVKLVAERNVTKSRAREMTKAREYQRDVAREIAQSPERPRGRGR